jgi:hypothetical protein
MLHPYVHGTGVRHSAPCLEEDHCAPLEGYFPLYVPKTGEIPNAQWLLQVQRGLAGQGNRLEVRADTRPDCACSGRSF